MEDIINKRLDSLLTISKRLEAHFKNKFAGIDDIIVATIKDHNVIAIKNSPFFTTSPIMVLTPNPLALLTAIVDRVRDANVKEYQNQCNPVIISIKLIDREYVLTMDSNTICYAIKSSAASNYAMKSIIIKSIISVSNFYDYVNEENNTINNEAIEMIEPSYDFNSHMIAGGRRNMSSNHKNILIKQKNEKNIKQPKNIFTDIILHIVKYVQKDKTLRRELLFDNSLAEATAGIKSAINIYFTEYNHKDSLINYLKTLIADDYKDYKFSGFRHNDYDVPYDFRAVKLTCFITHKKTEQVYYIANLYNTPSYEPLPCLHNKTTTDLLIVHPIVRLRTTYNDMFQMEVKISSDKFDKLNQARSTYLTKLYNDVIKNKQSVEWIGVFRDERYEKNKYNTMNKLTNHSTTLYI